MGKRCVESPQSVDLQLKLQCPNRNSLLKGRSPMLKIVSNFSWLDLETGTFTTEERLRRGAQSSGHTKPLPIKISMTSRPL